MTQANLIPFPTPVLDRLSTGQPLANGTLAFFADQARTIRKPVYQDAEMIIPYTNPITLDLGGYPQGVSGGSGAIYYKTGVYYITAFNSAGAVEWTWDNVNSGSGSNSSGNNITNYILNPQFRYTAQDTFNNSDLQQNSTNIAYNNWSFYRDNFSSTISLNFENLVLGQTEVPYNPSKEVHFSCSVAGNEARLDNVFILGDIFTFSNSSISIGLWAKSPQSTAIQVGIRQDFGIGGSSAIEVLQSVDLVTQYNFFGVNIQVPSVSGKTLGTNPSIQIIVRMPLSIISDVYFTNLQCNYGNSLLDLEYKTSEQSQIEAVGAMFPIPSDDDSFYTPLWDAVTSKFQYLSNTGEYVFKDTPNAPTGCLACDGSSYVTDSIIPSTKVRYQRLYNYWLNNLGNGNAFGYGSDGFQTFAYIGNNTFVTDNAIQNTVLDWQDVNTGFTITNSRNYRVPDIDCNWDFRDDTSIIYHDNSTHSNNFYIRTSSVGVVTHAGAGTAGFAISVVRNGSVTYTELTKITVLPVASIVAGSYWIYSSNTANYYVWYRVNGVGTDPTVSGRIGLVVDLYTNDSTIAICQKTMNAINGLKSTIFLSVAASALSGGEYFYYNNHASQFYGYILKDGIGTDPNIGGKLGYAVNIEGTYTDAEVALAVAQVIQSYSFNVPDLRGYIPRIWDNGAGIDTDADNRYPRPDGVMGDNLGTTQWGMVESHTHTINEGTNGTHFYPGSVVIDIYNPNQNLSYYGGSETRPKNFYTNIFVRI